MNIMFLPGKVRKVAQWAGIGLFLLFYRCRITNRHIDK